MKSYLCVDGRRGGVYREQSGESAGGYSEGKMGQGKGDEESAHAQIAASDHSVQRHEPGDIARDCAIVEVDVTRLEHGFDRALHAERARIREGRASIPVKQHAHAHALAQTQRLRRRGTDADAWFDQSLESRCVARVRRGLGEGRRAWQWFGKGSRMKKGGACVCSAPSHPTCALDCLRRRRPRHSSEAARAPEGV